MSFKSTRSFSRVSDYRYHITVVSQIRGLSQTSSKFCADWCQLRLRYIGHQGRGVKRQRLNDPGISAQRSYSSQLIGSAEPKVVLESPESERLSRVPDVVNLAQVNRSVDVVVAGEPVTRAMLAFADAKRRSESKLRHSESKLNDDPFFQLHTLT